jgi:hypothetical protein
MWPGIASPCIAVVILLLSAIASTGLPGSGSSPIQRDYSTCRRLRGGSDIDNCQAQKLGILSGDGTAEDALRFMDAYTTDVYIKMRNDEVYFEGRAVSRKAS